MPVQIPISRGMFALVDDEDAARVGALRWHAAKFGELWYARRQMPRVNGRQQAQMLHTFLTGWTLVDHVNGNGLDNRRSNMREASVLENAHNRRKIAGRSRFKGVVREGRRTVRWRARITVAGRRIHLGFYADEQNAAAAYDAAARRHYGEFAALNFPNDGERSALRVDA